MTLISAKEKARKIATEWFLSTDVLNPKSANFNKLCEVIELALKEQDRDTRHACAEAVLTAGDPHDACMNAHAV